MKPVIQEERTGCGITSVATVASVRYRQAQQVANQLGIFAEDPRLWSKNRLRTPIASTVWYSCGEV